MEASELLSDTFDILSSKEIKLLAMRAQTSKDLLEEDDMALANVVMQEAQMKIISQVCALCCTIVWAGHSSPEPFLPLTILRSAAWSSKVSAPSYRSSHECVSICLPGCAMVSQNLLSELN